MAQTFSEILRGLFKLFERPRFSEMSKKNITKSKKTNRQNKNILLVLAWLFSLLDTSLPAPATAGNGHDNIHRSTADRCAGQYGCSSIHSFRISACFISQTVFPAFRGFLDSWSLLDLERLFLFFKSWTLSDPEYAETKREKNKPIHFFVTAHAR